MDDRSGGRTSSTSDGGIMGGTMGGLRRSTRSTRTARALDPPFWESLGFDAPTSMNMANFTHFVRACQEGTQEDFAPPYHHPGDNFVPFHEQLLPHWRVFVKTLKQDDGCTLSISYAQMPRQVMEVMSPSMISMPKMYRLELERNQLDRDGFEAVARILRHQPTLRILALPENEVGSVESARILSEAVAGHPGLERLRLSDCGLGKDPGVLRAILDGCKGIGLLDLRRNGIDSRGVRHIADFIAEDHQKNDIIDLEGNALGDEDAAILVPAVKKNTHLGSLDLTENGLTADGKEEMMKAVFDTSSLNNVVSSNHHCRLVLSSRNNNNFGPIFIFSMTSSSVPFEDDMQSVNSMTNETLQAKIAWKVNCALRNCVTAGGSINLCLLGDVPTKCMPKVLEMVQTRMSIMEPFFSMGTPFFSRSSRRETAEDLSNIFDVLRGCEVALLFQYGPGNLKRKSTNKPSKKRPARKAAAKGRKRRKRSSTR